MSYRILWPFNRWQDGNEIEISSLGGLATAEFSNRIEEVADEQWRGCDALVSLLDLPPDCRERLEKCRLLVTPKVGFDNLDLEAWGRLGIPVCNVPDYGTQEVADHAIALMLDLMKGLTFHTRELKKDLQGNWRPALNPFGRRLSASSFGVLGLGRIGMAAALRARAFGMKVCFYDPYIENGRDLALGITRVHSLAELFGGCDVVSLHLPLTTETTGLVNAEVLSHAKPGLILVNTARGPIISLAALAEALRDGRVAAAGLDVLPNEPADPEEPLLKAWAADEEWVNHRLLLTPHSAFFTPESVHDMRYKGGELAVAYLTEGRLQNCVNEQFLRGGRR